VEKYLKIKKKFMFLNIIKMKKLKIMNLMKSRKQNGHLKMERKMTKVT
jgi:hypothetical protein